MTGSGVIEDPAKANRKWKARVTKHTIAGKELTSTWTEFLIAYR